MTVTIKKLDKSKLTVRTIEEKDQGTFNEFSCENNSMENFLRQDAYYSTIDLVASTNLVFYEKKMVGFFTLKKEKLKLDIDFSELDYDYSLQIARLAVDINYQKNGIGTEIIKRVIELAKTVNERFISLDALIEKLDWYENRGFVPFIESETIRSNPDGLVYMIMDLYDPKIVENFLEDVG